MTYILIKANDTYDTNMSWFLVDKSTLILVHELISKLSITMNDETQQELESICKQVIDKGRL